MNELMKKVLFEDEDGTKFEMTILKEFNYKNKNYAVLMEDDEHEEECDCEKNIGILEVIKEKDGTETFVTIEDDTLFDEVVTEAERKIYEE